MCYFKEIHTIENMNEMQFMITRIISNQKAPFNYENIIKQIDSKLRECRVDEHTIRSFQVKNMLFDTLEQMESRGYIYSFNNVYVPQNGRMETVSAKK